MLKENAKYCVVVRAKYLLNKIVWLPTFFVHESNCCKVFTKEGFQKFFVYFQ